MTPHRNQTRILLWWVTDGSNAEGRLHYGWELEWASPSCRSFEPNLPAPWGRFAHAGVPGMQLYGPNANCSWHMDFSSVADPPAGVAKVRLWLTRLDLAAGDRLLVYAGPTIYHELVAEVSGENLIFGTAQARTIEVSTHAASTMQLRDIGLEVCQCSRRG